MARQLYLRGVQVEKDQIVTLATGTRAAYIGVNLKTGKLEWMVPVGIELNQFKHPVETFPMVCDGVIYIVKYSNLMAVPLE